MRIIGGRLGGQPLRAPRGRDTRPTGDRVREALFSILGDVHDERVLDLFAGSGALGLEARSRGAAEVTFVDSSPAAVATIRDNLSRLHETAEVHRSDVVKYLERARDAPRQYDLVFLDPPYRLAAALAPRLSDTLPRVLRPTARVVVESDHREPLELTLERHDERRYGDTLIRIYRVPT
ncbi:MAG TPA: 16S rRNA (guanine(966)-N(2))-methyltransferase RsmD [Solirubrobacteraceae bacterium]|nr:16S rRNA (guanine(966)-N(2))-methyltransferase RsmD [Solirubrobacteraceae bacterium]